MHKTDETLLKYTIICVFLSAVVLAIDLAIPLGVAGGVPYIVVILVALRTQITRFIYFMAVFCTLLTILGYFYSPEGGELWKVLLNRFLAIFAIWVTTILCIKLLSETQKEIKTLRGFIPICSSCKNVRDDEGYWNQIEAYIHTHSGAQFSHSICPDCMQKLYPDYAKEIDNNINNKKE